jgi:hypothetical protein
MRLLLASIMTFASGWTLLAQAPTMIEEVGKLVTTVSHAGMSYSIYEYDNVYVAGELSVQQFQEAVNLVKAQLTDNEVIEGVTASQQVAAERERGKDLQVRTCLVNCVKQVDRGASGRLFVLERTAGRLQVFRVLGWIE